ncbi:S8 family serine peptidase [Candidatus Saccharibacteria bacterium]|nr:MAG: S8 family serine peptidase [Candidatus Saccharibacteria bacterium]
MKTNTSLIVITSFCIALMAGLVIYTTLVHTSKSESPVIPTSPISVSQRIGGVVGTTSGQATPDLPASPSSHTTEPATSTRYSSPDTTYAEAPKQAAIVSDITTEYPYRALTTPNDPFYTSTLYPPWALTHMGSPGVWSNTTGEPVVVAVIDTGFALQHEDLASQWYINPGESGMTQISDHCWTGVSVSKSSNSCDDDNNGYSDDWRGWNFYGRYQTTGNPCAPDGVGSYATNNNPQAGQSGDDIYYQEQQTCSGSNLGDPFVAVSHGTSTAGLVGATTNNGKGIASLNWNTKIMPLQVLGDDGSGWTSTIVAAIYYAVDNGAKIISMSLGGDTKDSAMEAAINYAYSHGVVIVAAAGNCGTGSENGCNPSKPGAMSYPALYSHVIAVGASDANDVRATFSSYGPGLDVVAPGSGAIVSPLISRGATPNDPATFNYTSAYSGSLYGTSFSTPLVASLASLILSFRPSATADEITALIDGSAVKVAGMNSATYTNEYGHGLVNGNTGMTIAASLNSTAGISPTLLQTGDYRSEHSFSTGAAMSSGCTVTASSYCTIRFTNSQGFERFLPYSLSDSGGMTGWQWSGSLLQNGEWSVRAMQGSRLSPSYILFSK